MRATSTLRELSYEEAMHHVRLGAALIDLRPTPDYLDVHIPGSLALLYEFGPGMASRARDCLPLDLHLVLMDLGHGDLANAAAALRGKGFTALGTVADAINRWAEAHGHPASTETANGGSPPTGRVLDVGDPGARRDGSATRIPIERLWTRVGELPRNERVVVAAGYGVRAALAVGILERAGHEDIVFWSP